MFLRLVTPTNVFGHQTMPEMPQTTRSDFYNTRSIYTYCSISSTRSRLYKLTLATKITVTLFTTQI